MDHNALQMGRHSMSHILAKAVMELYPTAKLAIGPAIDDGLYYDFELPANLTAEDYAPIEAKMKEVLRRKEPFVRHEVSREEAMEQFADQPYKMELISELPDDAVISIYETGSDFKDLCAGPHINNAQELLSWAFKIHSITGAYWKGDSSRPMLQRIYVYAFPTNAELKAHIAMLEEAKKRDHRKLGPQLNLFTLMEEGPGFPFFLPKGMVLKNTLIDYWREIHTRYDYVEISTPMMLNRSLWERSGHWGHYKNNMYTTVIDDTDFAIKPMNCPGGILVYQTEMHSYRDLPLRVGELGLVHRHELSGALHGLFRVRCFTQDDAHIFMTWDQMKDEIKNVVRLFDEVYSTFGLSYQIELSTMPEDHMGDEKDWEFATNTLRDAVTEMGKSYEVNEGDGAFYGPKLDFHLADCLGRTWQCGTIQLDLQLPERFELEYVGPDGKKHRPVMIHRVVFGSIERFIGVITEHFSGVFPFWLSPVQVGIVPIRENHNDYALKIRDTLRANGIRTEIRLDDIPMGTKIKDFRHEFLPYILIVGEEEMKNNTISLRVRSGKQINDLTLEQFVEVCKGLNTNRALELTEEF